MTTAEASAPLTDRNVPERKRTSPGLYVTAARAYEMWKADDASVHIIDVRIPEEYIFVGHAEMARNIPLLFVEYGWDADQDEPVVRPNPDFVSAVQGLFAPTDTLLLMCRSGGRSALAVNALANAGFVAVYNIVDGFEGDMVAEDDSCYLGKRMKNGWKNCGNPWTYHCDPSLLWITEAK